MIADLLPSVLRRALGLRGFEPQASAVAAIYDESRPAAAIPKPGAPEAERVPHEMFDAGLVCMLADKILIAWLRNRYQLLFPFSFEPRRLGPAQQELVIQAMVAAAQADGSLDSQEQDRMEAALERFDPSHELRRHLEKVLSRPLALNDILAQARDVTTGATLYAASLVAIDQRKPVNRQYLKYLAARLQLPEDLVGSLEQRFRSSG